MLGTTGTGLRILVVPGDNGGGASSLSLDTEMLMMASLTGQKGDITFSFLLPNEVSKLSLQQRLSNDVIKYNGIHFLGHSNETGVLLKNKELISPDELRRLVSDSDIKFVFLSACSSASIGQYLVNRGLAVCLAYVGGVEDSSAIQNSLRFYNALVKSSPPFEGGLRTAYDQTAPDDGHLLWLANGEYTREVIKPISLRMDKYDESRQLAFDGFQKCLDDVEQEAKDFRREWRKEWKRLKIFALVVIAVFILSVFGTYLVYNRATYTEAPVSIHRGSSASMSISLSYVAVALSTAVFLEKEREHDK